MKAIWLVLLAACAYAQPVIVAGPRVDDSVRPDGSSELSHSQFKVNWMTAANANRSIEFGTASTLSDGVWRGPMYPNPFTAQEIFVSGLLPATQYYYRACSALEEYTNFAVSASVITINNHGYVNGDQIGVNGGTTESTFYGGIENFGHYKVVNATTNTFQLAQIDDGTNTPITITGSATSSRKLGRGVCASIQTVTTAAEPAIHPAPPQAPIDTDAPAMPTTFATTATVASDCSDLQSKINTAASTSGTNHEIKIPASTICRGTYSMPAKTGGSAGAVVIRSAATDQQLPPEGSRVGFQYAAHMPKIVNNYFPASHAGAATIHGSDCTAAGEMDFVNTYTTGGTAGITPLFYCNSATETFATYSIAGITTGFVLNIPAHGIPHGALLEITGFGDSDVDKAFFANVIDADHIGMYGATGSVTACAPCSGTLSWDQNKTPVGTWDILANRPGSCSDGDLFIQSEPPALPSKVDWCREGTWIAFHSRTTIFGITTAAGASGYRWVGLEFRPERYPINVPGGIALWSTGNQGQGRTSWGQVLGNDVTDIWFDRVIIDALGYPNRTNTVLNLNGERVGIVESYVTNMESWYTYPGGSEINNVQIIKGSKMVFRNNHFDGSGITIIFASGTQDSTQAQFAVPPSDIKIIRNTFRKYAYNQAGTPENWAIQRSGRNRHVFECKRCTRVQFIGNDSERNWSDTAQGAIVAMTPTGVDGAWVNATVTAANGGAGTITVSNNNFDFVPIGSYVAYTGSTGLNGVYPVVSVNAGTNTVTVSGMPAGTDSTGTLTAFGSSHLISDLDIRYNSFRKSPVGLLINGRGVQDGPLTRQTSRIRVADNWFDDINGRRCSQVGASTYKLCDANHGGPYGYLSVVGSRATGTDSYALQTAFGMEDMIYSNNTHTGIQGDTNGQTMIDTIVVQYGRAEGLTANNNLFAPPSNSLIGGTNGLAYTAPSQAGTTALNTFWTTGRWQARGNGFSTATSAQASYPADMACFGAANLAAYKFHDSSTLNFRVRPDSPYSSIGACAGSGGKAAGVDWGEWTAQQGKVRNLRVDKAATSATVYYTAPDSAACQVELSTSEAWGSGIRVSDGGGASRPRSVLFGAAGPDTVTGDDQAALTTKTQYYVRVLCAVEQPYTQFKTL